MFLDPNRPWRKVKVTERRAAQEFAVCMRELADIHYRQSERIRVVLNNLSTHSAGVLYQTFPADEARRVLRRLEFHDVPKHASWLNMVEIKIGVRARQCLDRRIDSYARLVAETAAWEKQRNTARARITWMFTTEKARAKMGRADPKPTAPSGRRQRVKTSDTSGDGIIEPQQTSEPAISIAPLFRWIGCWRDRLRAIDALWDHLCVVNAARPGGERHSST